MHATRQQTARRIVLVTAAAAAVPAALPSGAGAHHQCVPSETQVTADQRNLQQPVDAGHRLPIFNSCGPHQVIVSYTEQDGTKSRLLFTQGDLSLTRARDTQDEPARSSADATPAQDARPAQRAKRRCKSARKAKSRAKSRARRRACRRRR